MNSISKNFKNEDGTEEQVIASSNDNYELNLANKYVLANRVQQKGSKLGRKFKNSILGSEIGVKNKGFSSVAILATVVALAALLVIYFMWRF